MAEKTQQQWSRAVRRWALVGAVLGLAFGVFAHLRWDGSPGLLGSVAFYVPMGAAAVLVLWLGGYRYDLAKVWGWPAVGWSVGLVVLLMALSIGAGCAQGICGDR